MSPRAFHDESRNFMPSIRKITITDELESKTCSALEKQKFDEYQAIVAKEIENYFEPIKVEEVSIREMDKSENKMRVPSESEFKDIQTMKDESVVI